jgi:UDP-2,4-diacetamido-2,4,6-trideoxy-beta-L-altropyranose hydrolase
MRVVIRADGGPDIGYGHLVRTGALASELLEREHEVTYATTTPQHAREVCPDGIDTEVLQARDNPVSVREFVQNHADVTVTDSYLADSTYQQQLREVSPLVVVADDARHKVAADALVNGNLYASELEYGVIGADPDWLLGPEYLLLRAEIAKYASQEPPWRPSPKRAIVTMGGSDVAELTPTVIQAFDGLDLRVDAIVGPGFSSTHESRIEEVADLVRADVHVLRDPINLPELMFQADFAITTASTTTYELLALGTPIVCLPVVDNQAAIAEEMRRRDAATVLNGDPDLETFVDAIHEYIRNPETRRERCKKGRELVDGRGASRLYRELISLARRTNSS